MAKDSHAVFPNGIRALVVDNDASFLRSTSLMLSLLNFLVATCETPVSAVKLLSGRLKDADVVFIDALRATTCGFDFRGIVESHLCIPVIYFFAFDYKVAGDMAEALRRTVWAATYVIKKPLEAEDLCRLWRVIAWSKILLRRGKNTLPWLEWPRSNQALPAAVQALLATSSTSEDQAKEDDDGREHFQAVRAAGRGRRRKLDDGVSSGRGRGRGCRGGVAVRGQPTRRLAEQMNVTDGLQSDDDDMVPSQQQVAQQTRQGVHSMDVQNQQHGRTLVMQPAVPRNISTDAAGPSSSNTATFAGAINISAPALLPAYQAPAGARATSPAPHVVYSTQAPVQLPPPPVHQQQQPVVLYNFGTMVAPPAPIPTMVALNQQQLQQDMFGPRRQGSWMGRRSETGPIMLSFRQPPATTDLFTQLVGGYTAFGPSPTGATDASVADLQPPSVGAQPADKLDDVLRAMMQMDDMFPRSNCASSSAEAILAPATNKSAAMQAALDSGNCSNYNARPFMVNDVNVSNDASLMAPQDLAVPTGNQVELGAPDIYGSLVESPGYGDMAAMFPSDQYDENTLFSLDALWDFDEDVPVHPEGQQVAGVDSTTAANATGIISNGGESGVLGPNRNMGAANNGLEMLEDLKDDNASDFLLPQDMNNGH